MKIQHVERPFPIGLSATSVNDAICSRVTQTFPCLSWPGRADIAIYARCICVVLAADAPWQDAVDAGCVLLWMGTAPPPFIDGEHCVVLRAGDALARVAALLDDRAEQTRLIANAARLTRTHHRTGS